jgi:fusion and transport protein UGO1
MHDLSQLFLQPTLEAILNDTFDLYDNTIPLVHLDHVTGNLSTVVASHLIVGYLLNPFDIIRTRLIAQSSSPNHQKYHGPFHGLTTVVQEEGLRALYTGVHLPVTLIYHTLVPLLRNVTPLIIDRALHLSSSSSPMLYTLAEFGFNTMELLITLPIDTIRKRLYIQLQGQHNRIIPFTTCVRTRQAPYTGMLDCGVKMLTEEGTNDSWLGSIGIGSLYKGFSLHWSSNLVTSLIKLVTGGNDDADW